MSKVFAPRAAAAVLFACLAVQVWAFISSQSNTYDEPAVIGAGVSYVETGSLALEHRVHPPLEKYLFGLFAATASPSFDAAAPSLLRDDYYRFGLDFLYNNTARPEAILRRARLVSLLLSLLLGFFVLSWAGRWFGPWGGVLALAAYVFEPNLLAHGGLANMDLGLACFLFIAVHFLVRYMEEGDRHWLIASGLLAGAAVSTKTPGIYFFLWSSAFLLWGKGGEALNAKKWKRTISENAVLAGAAFLMVSLAYQVRYLPYFLQLLRHAFEMASLREKGEVYFNFLHGRLKVGGWPHYYAVAFLVKTTLPFLVLTALSLFRSPGRRKKAMLLFPALSYVLLCALAPKQNGLRYILPAFPFFCVMIGGLVPGLGGRRAAWIAGPLVLWSVFEAMAVAPRYLAYFNELAGGPRNGYKWLVDSNLDWGQDFTDIRKYLEGQGRPEIIVASLGNADRSYYFGPHQDLVMDSVSAGREGAFEHVNSTAPARELLIVSASLLQGFGLSDPGIFSWLRDRPPVAQPGYSTFVYDVTADALSQFKIGLLYMRNHRDALALRQFRRAADLAPRNPSPAMAEGDLWAARGRVSEAARAYAAALRFAAAPAYRELLPILQERLKSLKPTAGESAKIGE